MVDPIHIERAALLHLPAIVEIYNQAVRRKFETAHKKEFSVADKLQWFQQHDDHHPVCVAVADEEVVGWYALSAYREGREALSGVREISYYVHSTHARQGVGTALIQHAKKTAKEIGVEHLLAVVLDRNERSVRLLLKSGFQPWGHLPDIANFDGERCGHSYFGYKLGAG